MEWINYIYYDQQRIVNYTQDVVKVIAEQLDATSRMTSDMILAEKGVCVMLGGNVVHSTLTAQLQTEPLLRPYRDEQL